MDTFMRSLISQNTADPSTGYTHDCRWAWCRLGFSDNAALVKHVIEDHIRKAAPVSREDILVIRRVEEGIGESLGLTGVLDGMYSASNRSAKTDPRQDIEGESQSCQPRAATPTFTSLSSPADSPGLLHVPDSPPFHVLVENAPYTKPTAPFTRSPDIHFQHCSQDSQSSTESSGSHASVAFQLTQSARSSTGSLLTQQSPNNQNYENGMNIQTPVNSSPSWVPIVDHRDSIRSSIAVPTLSEEPISGMVSNPGLSSPLDSPIRPPSTPFTKGTVSRQTWYQAIPPSRKRSRATLEEGSNFALARKRNILKDSALDSPPGCVVSPSHTGEFPPKIFSSGHLQIQLTPPRPSPPPSEDTREQSQLQDGWSQSSSQVPSYPVLQTQAPYQSQSQN